MNDSSLIIICRWKYEYLELQHYDQSFSSQKYFEYHPKQSKIYLMNIFEGLNSRKWYTSFLNKSYFKFKKNNFIFKIFSYLHGFKMLQIFKSTQFHVYNNKLNQIDFNLLIISQNIQYLMKLKGVWYLRNPFPNDMVLFITIWCYLTLTTAFVASYFLFVRYQHRVCPIFLKKSPLIINILILTA